MSEVRLALADALGPLHRVEREVRPIGDCRLFVACEVPSGPELLVKVLPGARSLAINDRAFEREVLMLATRLTHARLVAPRGAGRAGPFVYHTRPFVAGTTLRAWIAKNGPVPLARAVEVLRAVLEALAHAHAAQIAHGELIAENVLLTEEGVRLADTGIAGALGRSLTAGTPPPPPTPGDDMFAVGGLVHEMLAGRPPVPEPEPLERDRTLPAWLPPLVQRCRAKPATRWADASEALAAMRYPH